jgi:subtilisin
MPYFTDESSEKGVVFPLILIAALALIVFVVVANSAYFKDNIFSKIFSKPFAGASSGLLGADISKSPKIIPNQYIVVLDPGTDAKGESQAAERSERVQVTHVYGSALNGFSFKGSAQAAENLKRNPNVKFVSPDQEIQAVAQTLPTGIDRVEADLNAVAKIDGVDQRINVNVAVIDTGIDTSHSDLNVVGGVDCTGSGSFIDQNGHGTHVAGVIGALDNDSGVVGVAPGAKLWAVRVLDAGGGGSWSNVICGVDWVTATRTDADTSNDIAVGNMSLSGANADDQSCGTVNGDALHQAVCGSVNKGIVYAVAAGNNASDTMSFAPGSYDEVLTVSAIVDTDGKYGASGSTTGYGADDTLASYSNYGADVDISAPGTYINSTYSGNSYATISGTSMATPHVTGAVALYFVGKSLAQDAAGVTAVMNTITNPTFGYSIAQSDVRGFKVDKDSYPEPLLYFANSGPLPSISPFTSPIPSPSLTPSPTPSTAPVLSPSVSITSPTDGSTVKKGTTVTISTSTSSVVRVEFFVNNALTCTSTAAPFNCSWKVPSKGNSTYTIYATAYNSLGAKISTSTIRVISSQR